MKLHPAQIPASELLVQCDTRRQRRSGPGGQHRNKVETAVFITHRDSRVQGAASERRRQEDNRKVALFRLRINLAIEIRTQAATSPSPLWKSRTKGRNLSVHPRHEDFPSLLAELLNHVQHCAGDMTKVAELLHVTSSQLVKFLKLEPRGLALVNQIRAAAGHAPLR